MGRLNGWSRTLPGRMSCWMLLAATLATVLQSGCRADPWPLWEQYATRYVDGQGRVIDKQGADRTTSEGQAYAMFFAVVGDDRPRFDKLLQWTEDNLAQGDLTLRLPAWNWGKAPDGQWKVLDANSAADADLWMSYALLEAGRVWKEPRYENLGRVMASRIAQQEVAELPGFGPVVLPGLKGFHPSATTWLVNPSYSPLPILARFADAMPDGPWGALAAQQGRMLRATSSGGYAMDWVEFNAAAPLAQQWTPVALPAQASSNGRAAPAKAAQPANDGLQDISGGAPTAPPQAAAVPPSSPAASAEGAVGSYDAIRVYLWAGMTDPGTAQARQSLDAVPAMAKYLAAQIVPPAKVGVNGAVESADGPIGFSAAVAPYLDALGMKKEAKAQMDRVMATKDPATGLFGRQQVYYDQNLALFASGWMAGRFRFERNGQLKLKWK